VAWPSWPGLAAPCSLATTAPFGPTQTGRIPAIVATAPAAFAVLPPPEPAAPAPAEVQAVVTGGMPGWQIALIAVGAALMAAALAVLLDRRRAARQRASATAA
jgi:hypothetical protein